VSSSAGCAADALTVEACLGIEQNTVRIRVNPMDIYKYVYTYVYIRRISASSSAGCAADALTAEAWFRSRYGVRTGRE